MGASCWPSRVSRGVGGVGLLGGGPRFPFFSPSLSFFLFPFSFLLTSVTSSFWGVSAQGGGEVVGVVVAGGGCADEKLVNTFVHK
jgi:hypothetical protein